MLCSAVDVVGGYPEVLVPLEEDSRHKLILPFVIFSHGLSAGLVRSCPTAQTIAGISCPDFTSIAATPYCQTEE